MVSVRQAERLPYNRSDGRHLPHSSRMSLDGSIARGLPAGIRHNAFRVRPDARASACLRPTRINIIELLILSFLSSLR